MLSPLTETREIRTRQRLIALVPAEIIDPTSFAKKIHWLAVQHHRDVLYLTLSLQAEETSVLQRLLSTLEALTRDQAIKVETRTVSAPNWLAGLEAIAHSGDLVVCHAEQSIALNGAQPVPLSDCVAEALPVQVHTLTGSYHAAARPIRWLRGLAFWVGMTIILVGFSFLEFQIEDFTLGGGKSILLLLLICIEFGLIFSWNEVTH